MLSISCTKETDSVVNFDILKEVSKRSSTASIQLNVVSNSTSGELYTIAFSGIENFNGIEPIASQNLSFTNAQGTIILSLPVEFSQVEGSVLDIVFNIENINLDSIELQPVQDVIIIDGAFE